MEPFVKTVTKEPVLFFIDKWMKKYTWLSAGFSSRIGGVSRGPYGTLNCALHVGDEERDVLENRRRIAGSLGFSFSAWTCAEQVHGCEIEAVTERHRGMGREDRAAAIAERDALITDRKDMLLTAFFADCVPLYFLDPEHQAVGIAHAGWRGTALQVAGKTVEKMSRLYSCRPERMLAAIGPSIGPCCYEVGGEVAEKMRNLLNELGAGEEDAKSWVTEQENGKFRLNLQEINRHIMIKAGILPEHIEVSRLCTGCRADFFYSHRRDQGKTGRMVGWIGIKPGEKAGESVEVESQIEP